MNFKGIVEIELFESENMAVIQIIDQGKGIKRDLLDKVFYKGFSTKQRGNGLGLYHAKTEIENIGGRLVISNDPTTIQIKLPNISPPKCVATEINLCGIKKIYILDDEQCVHDRWNNILDNLDLELVHYFKSDDLLANIASLNQDELLLSDYILGAGQKSGIEVINELNAQDRAILVSGSKMDELMSFSLSFSGIKYLDKLLMLDIHLKCQSSNFLFPLEKLVTHSS